MAGSTKQTLHCSLLGTSAISLPSFHSFCFFLKAVCCSQEDTDSCQVFCSTKDCCAPLLRQADLKLKLLREVLPFLLWSLRDAAEDIQLLVIKVQLLASASAERLQVVKLAEGILSIQLDFPNAG